MTKKHGACLRLYFDELNFTGLASKFSRKIKVDTADVSNFGGQGHKEYLEGAYDWTGGWAGFFDNTDDGWDEVAFASLATGSDHYLGQVLAASLSAGAAAGDQCWEDVVQWTDQPREFDVGGAIVLSGDLQGDGGTAVGAVNFAGAVTGTGNKPGVNHGATLAAQTIAVTYRVLAVTGAGSIAINLETSTDNGGGDPYSAVGALASGALTGVGVVRKTYTGATEAWKRINVATFTGFTSVTLLVTVTVIQ